MILFILSKFGGDMESFTFFNIYDYTILVGLILIAIYSIIFFLKKTKAELSKNLLKSSKFNIFIGLSLSIISIVLFIYIEYNIDKTMNILKPISIMTSEPIVLISIALFLLGFVLTVIGIYRNIVIKNINRGS